MIKLPKPAADLVALADIIKNPDALDKVVSVIKAQGAEAKKEADRLAEEQQKYADLVEREKNLIADSESIKKQQVDLRLAEASLTVREKELNDDENRLDTLRKTLEKRESDLAIKEENYSARLEAVILREIDAERLMNEAKDASLLATREYDKYKAANEKLKHIVSEEV